MQRSQLSSIFSPFSSSGVLVRWYGGEFSRLSSRNAARGFDCEIKRTASQRFRVVRNSIDLLPLGTEAFLPVGTQNILHINPIDKK